MSTQHGSVGGGQKHRGGWSILLIPLALLVLWAGGSAVFFLSVSKAGVNTKTVVPAQPAAVAQAHDLGQPITAKDISRAATDVPSPITRTTPTTVRVDLTTQEVIAPLTNGSTYHYWTFNSTVPGPMLRVMQGDTVDMHIANASGSAWPHSIDLHAVSGPGGGSTFTQTIPGADTHFSFKALNPGLYIYHCATPPVPDHVANGMFGMILVEPPGGLPKVDHEYYVMQSEIYTQQPFGAKGDLQYNPQAMNAEQPTYFVFNGRPQSIYGPTALQALVGDRIRLFFGVGTFKPSNFHVIGAIFDNVYPEGGIGGPLERNIGLTTVPAGGTTIAELSFKVPGTYLIVDHSLNRTTLGALGQIIVTGEAVPGVDVAGN